MKQTISDSAREGLSALMDGEASELDLRRVLAAVEQDPELAQRWARYHLVHDVLHAQPARDPGGLGVAAAVAAAIRAPDASHAPDQQAQYLRQDTRSRRTSSGWARSAASFAVAASVTALVVLGARQLDELGDVASPARGVTPVGLVNSQAGVPVQASFGARPSPVQTQPNAAEYHELARQRLLIYSQQHAEHASRNTPQGMIPFARVPEIQP